MSSRYAALALVAAVLAFMPLGAWAEDEGPTLDQLKETVAGDGDGRTRADAAEAIAKRFFDPETLVPWLRERIDAERGFHVQLALAYALAAQGEKRGLEILIDALERTGHLGYVYLTWVSGRDFGGPGIGWNRPAWVEWLDSLTEEDWRELQRKKHLPRGPKDADAAGLERAIAWWDGLGFPDLSTLPLVRIYAGWKTIGDTRIDLYDYGFLLKEGRRGFTVFDTEMQKVDYVLKKAKEKRVARFEKVDPADSVRAELDRLANEQFGRGRFEAPCQDPFGVDYYLTPHRHKGFVLAVALHKQGSPDVALRLWEHLAALASGGPQHGQWSALELLQSDVRAALHDQWEAETVSKRQTWKKALAAYKAMRARFGETGADGTVELLTRMAAEERRYRSAATGGKGTDEERAVRLVLALPTVNRTWHRGMAAIPDETAKDALSRLIGLGTAAVPALIPALEDRRFTKSVTWHHGGKAYIRQWFRIVHVQDLARIALREIAQRDFGAGSNDMEAVRKEAEAWWEMLQTKGESAVLIAGVAAADGSSPAQARLLVKKFPREAFAPIREAIEEAEGRVVAELISALAGVPTTEARTFLTERAAEGPGHQRMAAARALHDQGSKAGINRLLEDWPDNAMEDVRGPPGLASLGDAPVPDLVALLFELEPIASITRLRAVLEETPAALKYEIVNEIHVALGFQLFFRPDEPPARPQPKSVQQAAEGLLVDLVLDKSQREGKVFAFGPGEPGGQQTNRVGEAAAKKLAYVWPDRYQFDPRTSFTEREKQRYDIVNTWRKQNGLEPLTPPEPLRIDPIPEETLRPLLEAWRAAGDDDEREEAEGPIIELGLGTLPVLRPLLAQERDGDARKRLDALVRRVAAIVREIHWSESAPAPNAAMRALVAKFEGKPARGLAITHLFRQCAVDPTEGTTGIDITLSRAGDDTGYVMKVAMTTHRVEWFGGEGGFILSGDGQELVDSFLEDRDSWWHESRGEQLDEILLAPPEKEVHVHRVFARVK